MSIDQKAIPNVSITLFAGVGILYLMILTLHLVAGFAEISLLVGIPVSAIFTATLMNKTNHLVKYSSYPDYIEFSVGGLLTRDSLTLKRYSQRIVKSHVQEISVTGFFLWKKIKVKLKSDSGRDYTATIPLRFISSSKTIALLEDISGTSMEEVWEADYENVSEVPLIEASPAFQ